MNTPIIIYPDGEVTLEFDEKVRETDKPIGVLSAVAKDPDELSWHFPDRGVDGDDAVITFERYGFHGAINASDIDSLLDTETLANHEHPFSHESLAAALYRPEQYFDI